MSGEGKMWRVAHGGLAIEDVETGAFVFATHDREIAASVVADHNARLDAGPVAWQWRFDDQDNWRPLRIDKVEHYKEMPDVVLRPLYTHPFDATAAEAALATAKRDAWIAAQGHLKALKYTGKGHEDENSLIGMFARGVRFAIRSLTPPAEAEGGRQDG